HPGNRALELPGILADRMSAAFLVRNRNHTIHTMWVRTGEFQFVGDLHRDMTGTIGCRNHGDVISCADIAILPQIAKKGPGLLRRKVFSIAFFNRILVLLAAEIGHDVVRVDPRTLRDLFGSLTDGLAVFVYE